jgi:hypothetical protein
MAQALTIRTHTGRSVVLGGDELGKERLDHGYALTVHREQGATSDRTHYLAEGGGRELAYVALSRARHHTTIHAVADNLDHALDTIRTDWTHTNHDTWISPTTTPGTDPRHQPTIVEEAHLRWRLVGELDRLHALTPPDVTGELIAARDNSDALHDQRRHLDAGTGPYTNTPAGRITRQLRGLDADWRHAHAALRTAKPWQRPGLRRQVAALDNHRTVVADERDRYVAPEARRLDTATTHASRQVAQLRAEHHFNQRWHRDHPEHTTRIRQLQQHLADLNHPATQQPEPDLPNPTHPAIRDTFTEIQAALDDLDAALDHLTHQTHPDPTPDQDQSRGHGIEL